MLFWGLISLLRTLIGLALLCVLGLLVYEFYTHYQARKSTAQNRSVRGGRRTATGRGLVKKPWTGEPRRGAGGLRTEAGRQSKEDRSREAGKDSLPGLSSDGYLRNEY